MALPALRKLTVVPPQDRGKISKEGTGRSKEPPSQLNPKESTFDLCTRFEEARMHLEAFLDGIYKTALADEMGQINAQTILVFCSMAQDRVKVMDKVFETITEGKKEE